MNEEAAAGFTTVKSARFVQTSALPLNLPDKGDIFLSAKNIASKTERQSSSAIPSDCFQIDLRI